MYCKELKVPLDISTVYEAKKVRNLFPGNEKVLLEMATNKRFLGTERCQNSICES